MIVKNGYITRQTGKGTSRNWWLIKYNSRKSQTAMISLRTTFLPKEYVGKKIRIKIEEIE